MASATLAELLRRRFIASPTSSRPGWVSATQVARRSSDRRGPWPDATPNRCRPGYEHIPKGASFAGTGPATTPGPPGRVRRRQSKWLTRCNLKWLPGDVIQVRAAGTDVLRPTDLAGRRSGPLVIVRAAMAASTHRCAHLPRVSRVYNDAGDWYVTSLAWRPDVLLLVRRHRRKWTVQPSG